MGSRQTEKTPGVSGSLWQHDSESGQIVTMAVPTAIGPDSVEWRSVEVSSNGWQRLNTVRSVTLRSGCRTRWSTVPDCVRPTTT
jgi:hypothetical protein